MKKIVLFVNTYWFLAVCLFILLLSAILRFWAYNNRWGLAYDQAHDAVLARYAVDNYKIPLLGPFSSAGPFQTGGEWYWFIMAGIIFVPFSVMGPWIFLTIAQVFFVLLMIYIGEKMVNRWFGLIVGFLAAISPGGIAQSINLTNQSILNITSAFAILFAVLYFKTRKTGYLFWLGFFSILGATIHFEGVPLVFLAIGVILVDLLRNKKGILFLIAGALIPLLPLIWVDATNHFFNIGHILRYYFHDQYKISFDALGRRWKTYIGVLWPSLWGNVIGGNRFIAYAIAFGDMLLFSYLVYKRKLTKQWLLLVGVFIIAFILIRYTRTPIFDSYIMFLHPFIFLFTGVLCWALFKKNVFAGIIAVLIISIFSLRIDIAQIKNATNITAETSTRLVRVLAKDYPNQTFTLYDYKYNFVAHSLPLVLYLQQENKLSFKGHPIGFGLPSKKEIKVNKIGSDLVDLQGVSRAKLVKEQWVSIDPENIYNSTQQWYLKKH